MSTERESFEEIGKKIKRDSDAFSHQMGGRKHMFGPSGTLNTISPCAACKLLRRRCSLECPFSPYFSPHEPQKFSSVHKVFGASNVTKMLMEVPESQRTDAANSLVYEANVRLSDPVYGCMGVISSLERQVQILQAELNAVRAEILKYKYKESNMLPSSQIASLLSPGAVSVAEPPPMSLPPPPSPSPSPQPPLLPALPLTPSSSPLYTPVTSSPADFRNFSTNNITYFG